MIQKASVPGCVEPELFCIIKMTANYFLPQIKGAPPARPFVLLLYVETEQDDIAIFDYVIFSFQANQAFLFCFCVSAAV